MRTIYSKSWELTGDVIQIRAEIKNEFVTKFHVFCNDTPLNIYFTKEEAVSHAEKIVGTKSF